jgi:hypothetical protein
MAVMTGADKNRCVFGRVIVAAVRLYHKDGNGKLASDSSPVVRLVHPEGGKTPYPLIGKTLYKKLGYLSYSPHELLYAVYRLHSLID